MPSLHLENSIVDDRYEVRKRLNHGSYAEIYEAYDLERGRRPVIIKALNTSLQGTPEVDLERTLIENFQNEAVALDSVSHPNVVRRLGHGTAADLSGTPFHYIVLEYLPGGDLMALCRRRPLSLDKTLYYVRQICEALAEAHARGVIHRDVKPNNLLLSADEQVVKITDFGVAKLTEADVESEVTRVGTDVYAPPEHNPNTSAMGVRERLTPSADVYSLAKTIYTAMTGTSPRQFVRAPIASLPEALAREPWGTRLLAVLRRATADAPSHRYPSVQAFWQDLSAVGVPSPDDDDEHTQVRPRDGLRSAGPLPQAAPTPHFRSRLATGPRSLDESARIVVTLDERPAAPPAPALRKTPPAGESTYSYRDDLKDLVRSGPGLKAAVLAGVLLLFGSVWGVYSEVHRYMSNQTLKQATVTAESLTLRDGPSPQSTQIGVLPYETRVRILRQAPNSTWCEIEVTQYAGPSDAEQVDRGWVNSRFLAVDGE